MKSTPIFLLLFMHLICVGQPEPTAVPLAQVQPGTQSSAHSYLPPLPSPFAFPYHPFAIQQFTTNTNSFDPEIALNHTVAIKIDWSMPQLPSTEPITNVLQDTYQTIKRHNKKLAFFLVMTSYLFVCYQAYVGESYSGQIDLWANWKEDLSLEQLLGISHEQLTQDLLTEIQRRYITHGDPTDFISPLATFMQVIDAEIKTIQYYKKAYEWLNWFHLTRFIPTKHATNNRFEKQLQKLAHFKNIFLTWTAQYKLAHNELRPRKHA